MRVRLERERGGWLVRFFGRNYGEVAYILLALRGLQAEIEFPSDWHEERLGWVRLGFGLFKVAFAFPWPWVVPDEFQCSGPTYGFVFFDTGLHLHWGKSKGTRDDPFKVIAMPWEWRHRQHMILSEPASYPYTYVLQSGEVQSRTATITHEKRRYTRPWLPYKRVSESISVDFDGEVGERTGSWKGGCTGCGYTMLPGESQLDCLRRMERERKF